MNVHVLRSPEYPIEDFNQVVTLLKTHTNTIKIKGHANVEINYQDESEIKHWDEFFINCIRFRKAKKISDNDYVFLLTEYKNQEDYFGWTDETLGNYFIQTSDWNLYFESEVNKHFPISYEVVAWILRSLMYDTQEELLKNAHQHARGCVMDYCDEKEDIILKMRTGDVCHTCLGRIKERGVNPGFLGNIFNTMENIRKGLMYRERNELLGVISPIRLHLGVDKPKFVLTEMNDLKLKFDESQTAIYLFLLQTGGVKLNDLEERKEELKECYRLIKNGNISDRELNSTIEYWVDPENPEVITQKVSKINKKLKDLLGESLAKNYQIINEKGKYKVKLLMTKVQIV
jgi:uncharacterized protein YfkK (UPF0435 family)